MRRERERERWLDALSFPLSLDSLLSIPMGSWFLIFSIHIHICLNRWSCSHGCVCPSRKSCAFQWYMQAHMSLWKYNIPRVIPASHDDFQSLTCKICAFWDYHTSLVPTPMGTSFSSSFIIRRGVACSRLLFKYIVMTNELVCKSTGLTFF